MYKSATQPLCRRCGKPIAKHTTNVWVREHPPTPIDASIGRWVIGPIKTKAEAQATTNEQVMAITRFGSYPEKLAGTIFSFSTWDRETYKDEFFCTNACAMKFAYIVLGERPQLGTQAWTQAVEAARGKEAKSPQKARA